jgi:hypothetical protein
MAVTVAKTLVCPRLISRTPMDSTPTTIPGRIGVWVRGDTCASAFANGSWPSRAIENMTRVADAEIASAAEKMETPTIARTTGPQNGPASAVST